MIDLTLAEDAAEIVTAATDLLARAAPLDRLSTAGSEDILHRDLADWGWLAMALPPERDGLGIGFPEESLIYLEAGRRLVAPSVLATCLALRFAPEALAEGGRAAFAIDAPEGQFMVVEPDPADLLVMRDGNCLRFHKAQDFAGTAVDSFDESLPIQQGSLHGQPLAETHDAGRATLLLAALLAGAASGAAHLAIEYAKVREQFGQPVGAFQAVKHRCADMGVAAFAAEAQVTMAAAALAEDAPEAGLELAAAVLQAKKAARANAAAAIQVHGGMGFTSECHAHRFLKRSQVLSRLIGEPGEFEARILRRG